MRSSTPDSLPTDAARRSAVRSFVVEARELAGERIERVVVFGSVARGEANVESDVDILIVWRGRMLDGLRLLSPIATRILLTSGVDIAPHVMPVEHFERLKQHGTTFYSNLDRDGLVVA